MTTEIGVNANDEWSVECDAEWLKAEKGENSVILTATENETSEERVAKVVLTCTDGIKSDSETITVTQDARTYITLSAEEFEFYKTGGEATVMVDANYDWDCECDSDWLTVSKNTDGSLTVTVNANGTGKGREGTVTVTAGDGAANVAEAYLTITQVAFGPDDFVLEYTIETDGTEIQLPLGEKDNDGNVFTIDCTVNWGDGSEEETVTGSWPSHTYSEAGTYTVIINGTVELLSSWDYDKSEDNGINGLECLTAVKQWGETGLESMDRAFYYCTNLASLPEGPGPFSNVTSFSYAFAQSESLLTVSEDIFSGCTAAKEFEYAFGAWYSLTTVPEKLFADCTAVESFEGVFSDCKYLETVPVGIFDNNTLVTDFLEAFENCSSLTGESPYTMIDGNKVHLYERENYPDNFTAPTSYGYCFTDCTFSDMDSIPSSWGGNGASPTSITPQSLNATSPEGFGPSLLGPQRDATRPHPTRK